VSSVKYELGFCIPEDDILHSHRRENLKSCLVLQIVKQVAVAWNGVQSALVRIRSHLKEK
jgi:hypothetical protein